MLPLCATGIGRVIYPGRERNELASGPVVDGALGSTSEYRTVVPGSCIDEKHFREISKPANWLVELKKKWRVRVYFVR